MKTNEKSTINKLVKRFDNELKKLIMNDLKAIKAAKVRFLNSMTPETFTAA